MKSDSQLMDFVISRKSFYALNSFTVTKENALILCFLIFHLENFPLLYFDHETRIILIHFAKIRTAVNVIWEKKITINTIGIHFDKSYIVAVKNVYKY